MMSTKLFVKAMLCKKIKSKWFTKTTKNSSQLYSLRRRWDLFLIACKWIIFISSMYWSSHWSIWCSSSFSVQFWKDIMLKAKNTTQYMAHSLDCFVSWLFCWISIQKSPAQCQLGNCPSFCLKSEQALSFVIPLLSL